MRMSAMRAEWGSGWMNMPSEVRAARAVRMALTFLLCALLPVFCLGVCSACSDLGAPSGIVAGGVSANEGNAGGADSQTSTSASSSSSSSSAPSSQSKSSSSVSENGTYTSKEQVALYIHRYGHLPQNFISKTKAKKAGWIPSEGNLQDVCPGKSIGGSRYYNDDGLLPDKSGRYWTECDIDYAGGHRNEKRIVFSNDGLVYYTGNHYRSFERLY